MKKIHQIVFCSLMALLLIGLSLFSRWQNDLRKYHTFNIYFQEEVPKFLDRPFVENLLKQKLGQFPVGAKDSLDLNRVEGLIGAVKSVQNAAVYATPEGTLNIFIEERKPYIRVQGSRSFYLDMHSQAFALSKKYTADVPLFFGDLAPELAPEVVAVVEDLQADPFWMDELVGLQKNSQGYTLQLRSFGFDVYFGTATQMNEKTKKIKAFCAYYKLNNPQPDVHKIDLTVAQQVVASVL